MLTRKVKGTVPEGVDLQFGDLAAQVHVDHPQQAHASHTVLVSTAEHLLGTMGG